MMNVVLIHPYITAREPNVYLSEPLGLVCLASYLKQVFKKQIKIKILDLYALGSGIPTAKDNFYVFGKHDENFIKAELEKLNPDLIGITCNFTAYTLDSLEVASIAKNILPHVPIVFGGAHATMEAENIIKNHISVDYVVRGEGEITLEYFLRYLQGVIPVHDVKGITFRNAQEIVVSNPERELIEDLDILPIPDRTFIDMEFYKESNKKCVWYVRKTPVATIVTSRGCPYNCIFCSTKVVWKKIWRPRSLEKVFEEIEMLVSQDGIKEIVINDDQFFTRRDRIDKFCKYFLARKLDLTFSVDAGVSVWLVDKELLKIMRKAGFYSIRFPIETGNEVTLKFIRKPLDLNKSKELIREANQLGFWTSANFIIGFPYETKQQIEETIRYAFSTKLDYASFLVAKPQAGSDLYEIFKNENLLDKTVVRASHFYRSDYDTATMKSEELNFILEKVAQKWFIHKVKFFLNPFNVLSYLLPKLKSRDDWRYFLKMFGVLFKNKIKPVLFRTHE
ncbi:MAG: radical SAM protein [Smithella sp.]|nr:radical SAM protein [Smithella sp.]